MTLFLLLLIPFTLTASEPKPAYKYKYLYPPTKSASPKPKIKKPKRYRVPNNSVDASYILAANKERWPEIVIKTEKEYKWCLDIHNQVLSFISLHNLQAKRHSWNILPTRWRMANASWSNISWESLHFIFLKIINRSRCFLNLLRQLWSCLWVVSRFFMSWYSCITRCFYNCNHIIQEYNKK